MDSQNIEDIHSELVKELENIGNNTTAAKWLNSLPCYICTQCTKSSIFKDCPCLDDEDCDE